VALVEPKALLADKGYGADRFVESLKVRAIKPVIPPKSNRKIKRDCDFALDAERNLVERFFNIIKHFRVIATRRRRRPRAIFWPVCIWSAHSLGLNDDRL
jgi:transposase